MEKKGMIRVKACSNGKEIFDYVKVSHLKRLIANGYVLKVLDKEGKEERPCFMEQNKKE